MSLNSVLTGAAFKTAIWSSLAFMLALFISGIGVYRLVESTMYKELVEQVTEELLLFQKIERDGGTQELIAAIEELDSPGKTADRLIGLFDKKGLSLAGNEQIAPDFIGWKSVTVHVADSDAAKNYYSNVMTLHSSMLVVGRSTQFIESTLSSLTRYLGGAGLLVFFITLSLGYVVSHRVNRKLASMTQTLNEVSQGNMSARLHVENDNDQIDRASTQINRHLQQLSTLMANTRNTIQAIAHDVRTPLNRAFLLIQDSANNARLDEHHQMQLEEAAHELENVTSIFDTVLRISTINASHDKQNFTVFPAARFLLELTDLFEPIADAGGQVLSCTTTDRVCCNIRGDRKMLRQMLVNLIENAICHCPAGAVITLAASATEKGETCIQVSDNGPGIPSDKINDAMEPFYRLDASRSTPGSGLGLALVSAIATRHQAQLTLVDNQPGLRVSIVFPPVD